MSRVLVVGVSILFAGVALAQAAPDPPPPPIEQVPADVAQWFTSTMDKILEPVTGPETVPAAPADAPKHRRKGHH